MVTAGMGVNFSLDSLPAGSQETDRILFSQKTGLKIDPQRWRPLGVELWLLTVRWRWKRP